MKNSGGISFLLCHSVYIQVPCSNTSFRIVRDIFPDAMAKARYPSTRDVFLMCVVHGIVLGIFSDKVQGDGNLYRGLYASEVEVLRDREIPADLPEEEFRSVRSASTCLQKCLGVPKCLSFQWNLVEGRCKLYNNSFSSSDNSQIGNRYYTVIKGSSNNIFLSFKFPLKCTL